MPKIGLSFFEGGLEFFENGQKNTLTYCSLGERRKERTIGAGVEAGGAACERGVDQPDSLSPPASMSPHQSAQRVTSADSRRKFFEHKHQ